MEISSRSQALAAGAKIYFTGSPCARGHLAPRYVSGFGCTQCARDRYAQDPAPAKAAKAAWRALNPDLARQKDAARYAKNTPRLLAAAGAWRRANPDARRAMAMQRRAAEVNATPGWFGELDVLVMLEAASLARLRRRVTGFAWHVDHAVPLKSPLACGLHVGSNIQVIPAALNVRKGCALRYVEPLDWLASGALGPE